MGVHAYSHILPTTQGLAKRPPATPGGLLIPLCDAVVIHFWLYFLIMIDHIIRVVAQFIMVTPVPAPHGIGPPGFLGIMVMPDTALAHDLINRVLTIGRDVKDHMITPVVADLTNYAVFILVFGP